MPENSERLAGLSPERRKLLERLLRQKTAGAPESGPPEITADPPEALSLDEASSPEEVKAQFRRFYNSVNRQLAASGFGEFSFFLNYGYVANQDPQYAAAPLPDHALNRNSLKLVLETIGDCELDGRDLLDAGCGRGGAIYVMNRFFQPRSTTGMDLSPEAVRFCRKAHRYPAAAFVQGDAEKLPFRAESFDAVSNVESSHSYPDIEAFYAEVYRVLRPGGHFLYTDSATAGAGPGINAALRRIGFELLRETDITANVLLSCDEIASRRREAFGSEGGILNDFLAVPGSGVYEELKSGGRVYHIWKLRK
ncbi:MAG: class I SAM-dependent methyltransferase [Acidobacteria bacterium]|nr:class I SAM-dependent methyltransferase [Acidobacteriota bacterium]